MSDTQRTRASLIALFADNVTGQISAQDLRDFLVTIMETEFVNPGDFWKQPLATALTIDKTVKGWIDYSQEVGSDVSFGNPVYLAPASGIWYNATVSVSTKNPCMGIAANSYTSGVSTAQILRKGIVNDSAYSARFSGFVGRAVYLGSDALGSLSVTQTTNSVQVIGVVERNSDGPTSTIFRFDPTDWAAKGA